MYQNSLEAHCIFIKILLLFIVLNSHAYVDNKATVIFIKETNNVEEAFTTARYCEIVITETKITAMNGSRIPVIVDRYYAFITVEYSCTDLRARSHNCQSETRNC
jgi:hypothetical protein